MRVTRREVAWSLSPALEKGPCTVPQLLEWAVRMGARPAVIELIHERLPYGRFHSLEELWPYLGDLPESQSARTGS